jgi:putative membrane protein
MQFFIALTLLIAAIILLLAFVLFALQNSAIVTVSFLSLHYAGSLALILVVMFSLGLLVGILISIPSILRKSSALREQKRRVKQLEESISRSTTSEPLGQEKSDKH